MHHEHLFEHTQDLKLIVREFENKIDYILCCYKYNGEEDWHYISEELYKMLKEEIE